MGISVKNVSKVYRSQATDLLALDSINLEIPNMEILALMGPSGSGKSTLLNIIGGLDSFSAGSIEVCGHRLESMSIEEKAVFRNETVGFIFQNFNLIPVLSSLENVLLPSQLSQKNIGNSHSQKEKATVLLEKVGLKNQINQTINRLSGGQMQRVAIARAMMNNPKLILADEPTANLDHKTADVVMETLVHLAQTEKINIILATHDKNILKYSHRIVQMEDGRILS